MLLAKKTWTANRKNKAVEERWEAGEKWMKFKIRSLGKAGKLQSKAYVYMRPAMKTRRSEDSSLKPVCDRF